MVSLIGGLPRFIRMCSQLSPPGLSPGLCRHPAPQGKVVSNYYTSQCVISCNGLATNRGFPLLIVEDEIIGTECQKKKHLRNDKGETVTPTTRVTSALTLPHSGDGGGAASLAQPALAAPLGSGPLFMCRRDSRTRMPSPPSPGLCPRLTETDHWRTCLGPSSLWAQVRAFPGLRHPLEVNPPRPFSEVSADVCCGEAVTPQFLPMNNSRSFNDEIHSISYDSFCIIVFIHIHVYTHELRQMCSLPSPCVSHATHFETHVSPPLSSTQTSA